MTGSHALGKSWVLVSLCLCFLGCSGSSGLFPGKELAWTRLDVEVAGPRISSAMVWDPVRHTFVLHAGQDVDWNLRPETWEWSPNSEAWRLIVDQSQQNPGPRISHAMVWDPTRERMILFGGTDLDRYFDDTWAFDGSTSQWVRLDTIGNPPPRSQHGMVYDPDAEQIIVFGGRGTNHEPLHDTWLLSLDSLEWIQHASPEGAPHPQARDHVQMARDPISGIIVMRGCSLGDRIANETWHFDAGAGGWSLAETNQEPQGMDHGFLCSVESLGGLVFFGFGEVPFLRVLAALVAVVLTLALTIHAGFKGRRRRLCVLVGITCGLLFFVYHQTKLTQTWLYRPQAETWTLLDVKGEQPESPMDHGQAASNGQHLFLLGGFGGEDLPIDAGLTPRGATWKF